MLNKNVMARMTKLSQVKGHPWFLNFKWDALECLNVQPPYKPFIKNLNLNKKMGFLKHLNKSFVEWQGEMEVPISKEEQMLNDAWFNKF